MEWYFEVFRKYAEFEGRSRRSEYWMFFLINVVVSIGLGIAEGIVGGGGLLSLLYMLVTIIPSLAVTVRRLHDTGRSGMWMLILFVPLIGLILFLVYTAQDSEAGTNQYGPNPKG